MHIHDKTFRNEKLTRVAFIALKVDALALQVLKTK